MTIGFSNNFGKIEIDDNVISNLAVVSVMETYGVVGLASKNVKDGIYELLKMDNMQKGVKVTFLKKDEIDIDISLFIEYGVRIAVVAENIIDKVKFNIENSLKIKVNSVNLYIQGIRK
ncbi:MAG: Asp23/Gls24 family envelope stress response protein [Peptoniphilaceae bacterium]|nr:Asp23/Gls24 family envelope stress response protein [Peptoniphilaceae bacterium]MDD7382852.1 Asp23/Gls24 family envelope stress response protein [Peptoniphilaceae bacterium]MDY3738189.1 Asp23/Gls24 family envelope stress response protein [Peptoniphilaceae bacterium]